MNTDKTKLSFKYFNYMYSINPILCKHGPHDVLFLLIKRIEWMELAVYSVTFTLTI